MSRGTKGAWGAGDLEGIHEQDCLDFLRTLKSESVNLIVTSPPYNIGKSYEKHSSLERYIETQAAVIRECHRVLAPSGSICWQVGNYVRDGEIVPLDVAIYPIFQSLGMQLRNRVVWHFEHGLHCTNRLSGRYETINWFTKTDDYVFNVDPIRVPQKYPGKKHFRGPKAGQLSGNPLGKNPGDVWIFPNVKHNHVEKTIHPCQFPVELVERLVLSLTSESDLVVDPYMGVGTTAVAAVIHRRQALGSELDPRYVEIARQRVALAREGKLTTRPMNRPVYDPARPKAINDEARAEIEMLRWGNEMACENTPNPACQCPGCETARERADRGETGP